MKRVLMIGIVIAVLAILIAGFTTPIFAHGPDGGQTAPADEEAWEAMHEACENGDWEAMTEAAEKVHGDDFDEMPCHAEDDDALNSWGGRGMMSW